MQLTGELKEKVKKATNAEEAKNILKDADVSLNDAALDQVSGGMRFSSSTSPSQEQYPLL